MTVTDQSAIARRGFEAQDHRASLARVARGEATVVCESCGGEPDCHAPGCKLKPATVEARKQEPEYEITKGRNGQRMTSRKISSDGSKTTSEITREHESWADAQPLTARCAFCDWSLETTAGLAAELARQHRGEAHPEIREKRSRAVVQRKATEAAGERAVALGELGGDATAAAPSPSSPSVEAVLSEREPQAVPPVSEPTDPQPKAPSRSENTKPRLWTREKILAAIVAWHVEHGEPPRSTAWIKRSDTRPTAQTVHTMFGTWNAAIAAAGFEPRSPGGTPFSKTSDGPVVGDPAVTGSAFVPGDGDSVSAIPAVAPLPVRPGPSEASSAIEAVLVELVRARARFAPLHSPHEAIAVIEEEYLELREHVHRNTGRSIEARAEAIQLAAMAVRYVIDLCNEDGAPCEG